MHPPHAARLTPQERGHDFDDDDLEAPADAGDLGDQAEDAGEQNQRRRHPVEASHFAAHAPQDKPEESDIDDPKGGGRGDAGRQIFPAPDHAQAIREGAQKPLQPALSSFRKEAEKLGGSGFGPVRAKPENNEEDDQNDGDQQRNQRRSVRRHQACSSPGPRDSQRREKKRGREEQGDEDRVVNTFQKPHRRHGRIGNVLLIGDVTRPDDLSRAADQINRAESHDLADKQNPQRGFLDRVQKESPAVSADQVTGVSGKYGGQQVAGIGADEGKPKLVPAKVAPLGSLAKIVKDQNDQGGTDAEPHPPSQVFFHKAKNGAADSSSPNYPMPPAKSRYDCRHNGSACPWTSALIGPNCSGGRSLS